MPTAPWGHLTLHEPHELAPTPLLRSAVACSAITLPLLRHKPTKDRGLIKRWFLSSD